MGCASKPAQAVGALGCGCIFAVAAFVLATAVLGGLLAVGGLGALVAVSLIFTSMFVGLNVGIWVAVHLLTRKADPGSTR